MMNKRGHRGALKVSDAALFTSKGTEALKPAFFRLERRGVFLFKRGMFT